MLVPVLVLFGELLPLLRAQMRQSMNRENSYVRRHFRIVDHRDHLVERSFKLIPIQTFGNCAHFLTEPEQLGVCCVAGICVCTDSLKESGFRRLGRARGKCGKGGQRQR